MQQIAIPRITDQRENNNKINKNIYNCSIYPFYLIKIFIFGYIFKCFSVLIINFIFKVTPQTHFDLNEISAIG